MADLDAADVETEVLKQHAERLRRLYPELLESLHYLIQHDCSLNIFNGNYGAQTKGTVAQWMQKWEQKPEIKITRQVIRKSEL